VVLGGTVSIVFGSAARLVVYDSESGAKLRDLTPFANHAPNGCSIAPDGELVVFYADATVQVWNAETGDEILRLRLPIPAKALGFWINSVEFSPDGKGIVIAARDGSIRIVNVRTRH
jgi:WD40 repeat protein